MKSLGLTVLSACALFVGLAATHAFEAGLGAQVPIRTDRLWFTELPPPGTRITSTIRPLLSTGSGANSRLLAAATGTILTLDGSSGATLNPIVPYGTGYRGPINFAIGSLSGDPTDPTPLLLAGPGEAVDLPLVAYGLGQPPVLLGELPGSFGSSPDGLQIAMGNVSGDGRDEVFVTGGRERPGHIRIIDISREDDGSSFPAFIDAFENFVRMAAGDLDGNGRDELIVGHPTSGEVKVFEIIELFKSFEPREVAHGFPFGPRPGGGVFVAAFDVNNDGVDDLITGSAPGSGPPEVRIFDVATTPRGLGSFFPFATDPAGRLTGVNVAAGRIGGVPVVAAVSGPDVQLFTVNPSGSNWVSVPGFAQNPFGRDSAIRINLQIHTPK